MRDGTMIEGQIQIGEEQTLVSYLNSRRGGWMNLTRARRPKLDEAPGYMIVQSDHVILASAPDGNVQIAGGANQAVEERQVEVVLVGGKTLRGYVTAASQQRLSDFVSASGRFMGLGRATLMPDDRALGDVALHGGAIEIFRDLAGTVPLDEGGSAPEPA
jgi:hypothetical protein